MLLSAMARLSKTVGSFSAGKDGADADATGVPACDVDAAVPAADAARDDADVARDDAADTAVDDATESLGLFLEIRSVAQREFRSRSIFLPCIQRQRQVDEGRATFRATIDTERKFSSDDTHSQFVFFFLTERRKKVPYLLSTPIFSTGGERESFSRVRRCVVAPWAFPSVAP